MMEYVSFYMWSKVINGIADELQDAYYWFTMEDKEKFIKACIELMKAYERIVRSL